MPPAAVLLVCVFAPATGFAANIAANGLFGSDKVELVVFTPLPSAARIMGSLTSLCILESALNPSGCASMFAKLRSVSRICSAIRLGFAATSKVRRNVSGSFNA